MGRWAWSSDAWDFDHDGYSDLYIANGYISGSAAPELSSFFWRQVVGNSPSTNTPSLAYERGWNAINELIRSDHAWNGHERNTVYVNNGDGTFSDVSGVSGLDFLDDSRSYALADFDGDGRIEVILERHENEAIFRVRDNGIGVEPAERDKIFQRFYRTESGHRVPGSGLGLSIAAAIANLHDFDLRFEDNDPGAVFEMVGRRK